MKKIICIGECALDLVFENGKPTGAMPGGRIAQAAAQLSRMSLPVTMASEASADPVGDMLVDYLMKAGVDCSSIDRFVQGHSPLCVFTSEADGTACRVTRYEAYGDGGFDIVWPRVDDETIVVFGGYYCLDSRMRERLVPFLTNCNERNAVMVYVPGFRADRERRLTRVMPAILENLELSDLVITRNHDLQLIFGSDNVGDCYNDHIDFYCHSMINADIPNHTIDYYSGREVSRATIPAEMSETLLLNSGIIAGTAAAIYRLGLRREQLDTPAEDIRRQILASAADEAAAAARDMQFSWQQKI